jgi:hypothetical protein
MVERQDDLDQRVDKGLHKLSDRICSQEDRLFSEIEATNDRVKAITNGIGLDI